MLVYSFDNLNIPVIALELKNVVFNLCCSWQCQFAKCSKAILPNKVERLHTSFFVYCAFNNNNDSLFILLSALLPSEKNCKPIIPNASWLKTEIQDNCFAFSKIIPQAGSLAQQSQKLGTQIQALHI